LRFQGVLSDQILHEYKLKTWRIGVLKLLSGLFLLLLASVSNVFAQGGVYPNKPIRVIVPFAPGGGTDVIARPLTQKLGDALGQPIVYDNRGGGGGIIGAELVAKATPDGYTLLLPSSGALVLNVGLYAKLPYDPIKDFAPISMIAIAPNVLVLNPALPVRSVSELIAHAKANPEKLNWAGSGGGAASMCMELFRMMSEIRIVQVPFKGAGPAVIAVLAGDAHMMFGNAGVFVVHLKSGRLRAIGVSSLQRLPALPDVPTISESGLKGFEGSSWYGLVAPRGTPAGVITQLNTEINKILRTPDIIARYTAEGAIPAGNSPTQFGEEIRSEITKWVKVIKDAGIKPE